MNTTKVNVTYQKSLKFLDFFQYIFALIIAIGFTAGIFGFFKSIGLVIIYIIVAQILLSLVRLKILNMIIETILLILAIISLALNNITYFLALPFIFIGFLASILDLSTIKYVTVYKMIETRTFDSFGNKKKVIKTKKKVDKNVKEASFKEKDIKED